MGYPVVSLSYRNSCRLLKSEFYYLIDHIESIESFITNLGNYISWYNEKQIKRNILFKLHNYLFNIWGSVQTLWLGVRWLKNYKRGHWN